jgi:hypothetical protein
VAGSLGPLEAVVVGPGAEACRDAVARQTRVTEVTRVAADLGQALAGAPPSGWLWLLSSCARPEPDALEHLCGALEGLDGLPAPALLASLPVDGGEQALPRGAERSTELLLQTVPQGLVPIRHAALISLLVDAAASRAVPPPAPARHGRFADRAWTGRLLSHQVGYLVSASRVRAAAPRAPELVELPAIARMLRDGAWTRGETVRAAARALDPRGSS